MLLAVDIGNARIGLGVFDEQGELKMQGKITAVKSKSSDEYAVLLHGILNLNGFKKEDITDCIIASVVPPLTVLIKESVRKLFGINSLEVASGIKTGLNIRIDNQTQLGADIVANSVAALEICKTPLVIVDIGTATTFTVIDENSVLQGVIITAGLKMALEALSAGASELPDVSLSEPKRIIAKNSKEAMNVGALYGHGFMIDGFLDKIKVELGVEAMNVVVTGGLAPLVLPYCENEMEHHPNLTFQGLRSIYLKNKK